MSKRLIFSVFLLLFYMGSFFYFIEELSFLRVPFVVSSVIMAVIGTALSIKKYFNVVYFVFYSLVIFGVFLYVLETSSEHGVDWSALFSLVAFWVVIAYAQSLSLEDIRIRRIILIPMLVLASALLLAGRIGLVTPINPNAGGFLAVALLMLAGYGHFFKRLSFATYFIVGMFAIYTTFFYLSRTSSVIAVLFLLLSCLSLVRARYLVLVIPAFLLMSVLVLHLGFLDGLLQKNAVTASNDITNGRLLVWTLAIGEMSWLGRHSADLKTLLPYGVHSSYIAFALKFGLIQFFLVIVLLAWLLIRKFSIYSRHWYIAAFLVPFLLFALVEEVLGSHIFLFCLLGAVMVRGRQR